MIEFGRSSHHALLLMDAVADGRIECPLTAWHCCLEFYSVTTRLPEEYRLDPETALRFLREEIFARCKEPRQRGRGRPGSVPEDVPESRRSTR